MSATPIVIAKQGVFSAGGIVETNPGTFDHAFDIGLGSTDYELVEI